MIYLNEREFISTMRLKHLDHAKTVWNIDIEKIKQLEKKYGHIQYLPIDASLENIPQSFIDYFFKNSKLTESNYPNYDNLWSGIFKQDANELNTKLSIQNKNDSLLDLEDMFDEFFCNIKEVLPYKELKSYSFVSNQRDVLPHKDYYYFIGIPISFRCVIYNEGCNITNSFYDYIPTGNQKEFENFGSATSEHWDNGYTGKVQVHDVSVSKFFTYNNLTIKHDAKKHKDSKKILFIPKTSNPIDWDKFEELIDKSLIKYKTQSMISNLPIDGYVEIK